MNRIAYLTLLLLVLTTFSSCELEEAPFIPKETPIIPPDTTIIPVEDFRSKFCGDFLFTSCPWITSEGNYYFGDTVTYIGTISKLGRLGSLLKIRYRSGNGRIPCPNAPVDAFIHPTVQPDGILKYPEFMCGNHSTFGGTFLGIDIVNFDFGMGGNGWQEGHRVHGERIR